MKRDIRNTKKMRNRKLTLAMCLFSTAYALSGCGGENEVPEEQTSAYIYVAQQLATSPSGGYSLPEGFRNPAVEGGQIYYMHDTYEPSDGDPQAEEELKHVANYAVERTVFPEDGSAVDFAGAEVLFSISAYCFERSGEGTGDEDGTISEDEVLAMVDTAMEEQGSPFKNPEKNYFCFSLLDYTVDQEQNLYFALNCSLGSFLSMENMGTVLCKRTPEGEWAYRRFFSGREPKSLVVGKSGVVYLLTAEGILSIDRDGHETGMTSTEEFKTKSFSSEQLLGDSRGNAYYFVFEAYNSRWKGLGVVPQGGKGLKEVEGLSGSWWVDAFTISQGNVFFSASGSFHEYDMDTKNSTEILQWANSGLIDSNIKDCIVLEKERLLVWYDEPGMEGLYLLVKTPVEELPERKVVVLAAFEAPIAVKNAVVRFNRLNKEYQVLLENYGYTYENASGAQVRLGAALSSSTPPDLLLLSERNMEKDMEKGLLEDLSPYLESSDILDREDFLENALEGYTIGGCLAGIPVRFTPTIVGGRASQLAGLDSWTMEDVYTLAERYPEQTLLLSSACYDADTGKGDRELVTRKHLLEKFCTAWYLEECVDWEHGMCNFDTEGFRRLLGWVGEHSEEPPASDPRNRILYRQGTLPEEALLMEQFIDFESIALWKVQCGGELMLTGFPTTDGRGTVRLNVESPLGIVAGAGNSEGAWEFLEYYISSAADEKKVPGLLTRRAQLLEQMEQALQSPLPFYYYLDGEEITVYELSPELMEKLMEFLERADFTPESSQRNMVVSIVLEETEAYYTGDKSLDEVIGIIQNRVQLLLNENR